MTVGDAAQDQDGKRPAEAASDLVDDPKRRKRSDFNAANGKVHRDIMSKAKTTKGVCDAGMKKYT